MEQTSFHGSRLVLSLSVLLLLSLSFLVETYRLKKSAEINHWKKELSLYSKTLDNENQLARDQSMRETR